MLELVTFFFLADGAIELPTGEDIISKVFPNFWAFIIQLIAFIIMMTVVIIFAYKPVHKFIEKRKEFVANNLKEAEEKNLEATKNLETSRNKIKDSEDQAIAIIQDAKKLALEEKENVLAETKREIDAKHIKAKEDILVEQDKALKELHDDVVDIALSATETILNREVNKEDDKKLVDDFVKDLMEK